MANLVEILTKRYPNTIWTCGNDDYNTLAWYPENTIPKPTELELRGLDAEVSLELKWDVVRADRDELLQSSDWTQLSDSPLDAGQKAAWASYRQELRNVPQQQVEPETIIWPTQP